MVKKRKVQSIGFPCINKEPGEKRAFLPEFVSAVAATGADVRLEEGYGFTLGYSFSDYSDLAGSVVQCSRERAFSSDLVILLRSPEREEFDLLKAGTCLISMLHFPTRPWRVDTLRNRGVAAVGMDQIVDDSGDRLIENFHAVAWNGLDTAFTVLEKRSEGLFEKTDRPITVLVLGTGRIGKLALEAAVKMGSPGRNDRFMSTGAAGSIAVAAGRNVTGREESMKILLGSADIVVDATQRNDSSKPVLPNEWIRYLPDHAIITDLSVDPYLLKEHPAVVRGIEGIPRGNLDKYIFMADDPAWMDTIPAEVPADNRRTTVSCYSWPGIHPKECMHHYGEQILPFVRILVQKGYGNLNSRGDWAERALYRGTLTAFLGKK